MCMAVGNVSLDDCDMLTWSLGCTGVFDPRAPPAISMARLAMTSLAFMLVWVPLPVCHTRRGKWSSSAPAVTSAAAREIRSASLGSRRPRSALVRAEASLRIPMARITERGMMSSPMAKWTSDRAVWAPQYRSAGTSMGPIESVSVLVAVTASSPSRTYPHSTCARIAAPSSLSQPLDPA